MDANNMGLFLLDSRKRKNLTQKDVAMLCNVSTQAVSKWERGESFPDIEILEKLSILYNISINELINGEKKSQYIDVDKRKNIISLTFSVLVFFSYLLSFVKLDDWGITTILKGYQVIANGISGNIIIYSWVVFLILVSYLILYIFLLARVIDKTKIFHVYVFISYITIIALSVFGILNNYYLFLPQAIILICTTVIYSQSISKEVISVLVIKDLIVDVDHRIRKYFTNIKKLKTDYLYDIKHMNDLHKYKVSTYVKPASYISFNILYLLVIAFILLILSGIVVNIIDDISFFNPVVYGVGIALFIDVVFLMYSLRYMKSIIFGAKLKFIWIFHSIFYIFSTYYFSPASWVFIVVLILIIVYILYSNKLLSYTKTLVN